VKGLRVAMAGRLNAIGSLLQRLVWLRQALEDGAEGLERSDPQAQIRFA
jgi:hypothetical protein